MNLVAAVASGKPFRRPTDVECYGKDFWVTFESDKNPHRDLTVALGKEDILATDWEVKETKVPEDQL